jgi:DNA-binding phage protein
MIVVREYLGSDGKSSFGVWFDHAEAAAKVSVALSHSLVWRDEETPTKRHRACAGQLAGLQTSKDRRSMMALTRDFKETIRARVERDPKFRKELLREGVEAMVAGDVATAKAILRDYINATVGFTELSEETHIPSKSLMRMLGPSGNPRADNLLQIVCFLQEREGVRFQIKVAPV